MQRDPPYRWGIACARLEGHGMVKVLVPLPSSGFDPTEAALSWQILHDAGHELIFTTPDGARAHADPLMLSGKGLDPWGWIPMLRNVRAVGLLLRANRSARAAYKRMEGDANFLHPLPYEAVDVSAFDALLLPGGHAREMRPYLESAVLQRNVAAFFDAGKPVGAICHGVVLAARSISPRTNRSVLNGRKTTALTWSLERIAARIGRIARFWDPAYYRTYTESAGQPAGHASVQAEVTRALADPADFLEPSPSDAHYRLKTDGLHRDTATDARPAFVICDGVYVSARWPGDVHTFAQTFSTHLSPSITLSP